MKMSVSLELVWFSLFPTIANCQKYLGFAEIIDATRASILIMCVCASGVEGATFI